MSNIKKIRQEIERLYNGEAPKHDQQCEFEDGYFTGLATISNFIDSLSEEKPCENLNDEIKKFIEEYGYERGEDKLLIAIVARHFAEWQKQCDAELIEIAYNDGITIGKTKQKEQMLKDAVEGYVNYYEDSGGILMAEAQVRCPYHNGDKVKIIIVKNEE